jgi:hypothetical protein
MDEQYVYVDSRLSASTPNSYTLHLNTPLYSVTRVDLVSACVPTLPSQNTLSTSDPYIFLDIEQFRSKYGVQGCRSNLESSGSPTIHGYVGHIFYGDVLSNRVVQANSNVIPTATGNTTINYQYSNTSYINYTERQYKSSVTFKQPIESVDKLTIRWVDRLNTLVPFSDHSFMLRVYTTQRSIDDYSQPLPPEPTTSEGWLDFRVYIVFVAMILGILILMFSNRN